MTTPDSASAPPRRHSLLRREGLQLLRYIGLALVIFLIHLKSQKLQTQLLTKTKPPIQTTLLDSIFNKPAQQGKILSQTPLTWDIVDQHQSPLGYAFETLIPGQQSIGFSGPTNLLVITDTDHKILHVEILQSQDTPEYVEKVRKDNWFFSQFKGKTVAEISSGTKVDALSGATLTSFAIIDALVLSSGKAQQLSSRFPAQIELEKLKTLLPQASKILPDSNSPSLMQIMDNKNSCTGWLLRTSPAADQIIGYQGPTDTWVIFDQQQKVLGLVIATTFDNKPYIDYVRTDASFSQLFAGKTQEELAFMTLESSGIEGVSGATMTSQAISESIFKAASVSVAAKKEPKKQTEHMLSLKTKDYGLLALVLFTIIYSLSPLRGIAPLRIVLRLIVIAFLGLYYGGLLSQAMWIGWIKYGIPLKHASGFLLLTAVALFFPIFTRQNIYCNHLCPHGALQQLIRPRKPRWSLDKKWFNWMKHLKFIPAVLLLIVVILTLTDTSFSLVNLEPFDAYLIQTASLGAIIVFALGILASWFEPMAYCRYGCPTGSLLDYIRRHGHNGILSRADFTLLAAICLALIGYCA